MPKPLTLKYSLGLTFVVMVFLGTGVSSAQDDPGGGDGGDIAGDIFDAVDDAGGVGGGGDTGGGTVGGNGGGGLGDIFSGLDDVGAIESEPIEDERDSTFVGISVLDPRENQEFRHVGPIANTTGGSTRTPSDRSGNASRGNAGGRENGFRVQRTNSIRSRIVPRFRSTKLNPNFVSTRINQRLSSLPATRQLSRGLNISMQGRTAVISGSVQNQKQIQKLSRQLRLEPGVSRVVNRASVGQ